MLTEKTIRDTKAKDKRYMLLDANGLYLEIYPTGTKSWRLRIYYEKKEIRKTLGLWPQISLKEARALRDEEMVQFREKAIEHETNKPAMTFETIADEWLRRMQRGKLSDGHVDKVEYRLDRHLYPKIGKIPANEITSGQILQLLRAHEDIGHIETAHRLRGIIGQVYRYAIASGYVENDPTYALSGALAPRTQKHFASVTAPEEIGQLMRAIRAYVGGPIVKFALQYSAYTFCRPGEIRTAEWNEIDTANATWRIPAEKMKCDRVHIVPMSRQVLDLLPKIKDFSGESRYLFPSQRTYHSPMSDGTINAALRSMGYDRETMTGHGFRSMASTRLNESGLWNGDVIERQLAHISGNGVRAAYNYAEYLPDRIKMMQWWADYLDEQRDRLPKT